MPQRRSDRDKRVYTRCTTLVLGVGMTAEAETERKKTERKEITQAVINETVTAACVNDGVIYEVADTEQTYLRLRRRNKSVKWLVRTRSHTITLGKAGLGYKGDHLNLRDARRAGKEAFADLVKAGSKKKPKTSKVMTWANLVDVHLNNLAGKRSSGGDIKLPSRGTQGDVRTAFGIDNKTKLFDPKKRPSLAVLQDMKITDLDAHTLGTAHRAIKHRRPREKFLTYAKSMLGWAYSNSDQTGLRIPTPWWTEIKPVDLNKDEIKKMEIIRDRLQERKSSFKVEHVGQVLAVSEEFCAGKTGNEKVSPGIRMGFWWWGLTANRRGSTAKLERVNIVQNDPLTELPGWGSAFWDAGEMKGRRPFLLGVPPIGMRALEISMGDWHELVKHSHGASHTTKWAFASTQRVQRDRAGDDLDTDISIHPRSLAAHIEKLRGTKNVPKDKNGKHIAELLGPDLLKGIPPFNLHTVRAAATSFFSNCVGLPPAASSAFLAHAHKFDENDPEAMSQVTEKFYLETQRMPLKIKAMQAWSDAVMEAYYKAGGKWPEPYPPPKFRKFK
jgi:hypothetical protein